MDRTVRREEVKEARRGKVRAIARGNIYKRIGGGLNQGIIMGVIEIVRKKRGVLRVAPLISNINQNHRAQGKELGRVGKGKWGD